MDFRRNHFELKVKKIQSSMEENAFIFLYISKFFDESDEIRLEVSYFSENLSLSIILPKMPSNKLEKLFSADFIVKHKTAEYQNGDMEDLETIHQDFYDIEKLMVLTANELALDYLNGIPLEDNPLLENIKNSAIGWVVFCHALKNKKATSDLMNYLSQKNPKAYENPVFDILPFVHEDVSMAFD
jgi:hypothetical protein